MKDLKHLYYFEKLLEDANNELVRKAREDGLKCVGSTCYQIPEVLCNLKGCFSARLRAPRTGSMEMGTYYMTSFLCEYSRALLERAIEGGYQFLDCLLTPDGCTMINRCVENMELLKTIPNEGFFYQYLEVPMKDDDNGLDLYVRECRSKILDPLHEHFGIDTSDEAIKEAVEEHNKLCRLITELGEFRKEDNPRITGYEFHIITMCTYVCPHYLLLDKLEETLEEVKNRVPDEKKKFRARVVADRYCFGSLPGRQEIVLNDKEDVLTQICAQYMHSCMCPRHMNLPKFKRRKEYVNALAKEYKADGIIYEQMKFCDPWAYERMTGTHMLRDDYDYPVLSIDRPYAVGTSGQIRTRVQAFVESIEIKKIQGGNK